MTKHVLVITPSVRPGGGPAGYVYNHMVGYEELRRAGKNKNEFVFFGKTGCSDRSPGKISDSFVSNIKKTIVALGLKHTVMDLIALFSRKKRQMKSEIKKADIVIFQGPYNTNLARYAKQRSIIIYMPHSPTIAADEYRDLIRDSGKEIGPRYYENLKKEEKDIINIADTVVFPSIGAGKEYERNFSMQLIGKVVYLKSGLHTKVSSSDDKTDIFEKGKVNILFAGRYVSHRGYDIFCDAARLLSEAGFNALFYCAGTGPLKIDTPHVQNLGWRNDIFDVIRSADIIAVPNRIAYYDLFPLECAACGKPMVMAGVGGNADQIKDLPDVIPCQPTVESLATAIRQAVEVHRTSDSWGEQNRHAYEEIFTAERLAQRWDEYVSSVPLKLQQQAR